MSFFSSTTETKDIDLYFELQSLIDAATKVKRMFDIDGISKFNILITKIESVKQGIAWRTEYFEALETCFKIVCERLNAEEKK